MTAADRIRETTSEQRRAADPGLSAFVSANAGAGKTRVLTNRVARLLLKGVKPSAILCITFTKAAAAEMADRLFSLLGDWALADDARLSKDLQSLDGDLERPRSSDDLRRARRLFARALETPGGLKIQTIHSFCESVLKRFPLEAGVPPGFAVIDELETTRLAHQAVASVAASAMHDPALGPALSHLLSLMTGDNLRDLLEKSIADRRKYARAASVGWPGLADEARAALGAGAGDAPDAIRASIISWRTREELVRARDGLARSGDKPRKQCAAPLTAFLEAADDKARVDALAKLFFKSDGAQRMTFGTKATTAIDPWIEDFLSTAQQDFIALFVRLCAAQAFEGTRALYALLEAIFAKFESSKTDRAALDFDDLITLTRRLLTGAGKAEWVLYKLDQGLEHILLDEAQDTGPEAWDVIERPLAEFFSGLGAQKAERTFFAVGDKKQSIYSFQGADAKLFDAKELDLGKKIAAAASYANVPLKASFRTTEPVLRFVDTLFARNEVFDGVSDSAPEHHCTREGQAGGVEIWPLVPRDPTAATVAWDAPLDQASATNPKRRLAEAVAAEIAGWLSHDEILPSQGRAISPGDIMILVQTRSALFHEMIRALGRAGVPVAGADRIALVEDQAVLDLLSYARASLFDGDDLSLAETLKGPFFNVSEDDLFDLAHHRGDQSLWRALCKRGDERADWSRAAREIAFARTIAATEGPVAFFSHILETGSPSGWRRLMRRLGPPAREPVEEFMRQALEFEGSDPRSLRMFLDSAVKSQAIANRDSAEPRDSVRVMTAHKAKGLEASIVFILDGHRPPSFGAKDFIYPVQSPSGDLAPALAVGEAKQALAIEAARARRKQEAFEEYRRLLYVAATRAKDRLIICGHQHGNTLHPQAAPLETKTWHALALDAFDALGADAAAAGEKFGGVVRRLSSPQRAAVHAEKTASSAGVLSDLPDWASQLAPTERRMRRLSPSTLGAAVETGAYAPARSADAILRGQTLHRLLELLPEIAPERRVAAAHRLAGRMVGIDREGLRDALVAEAMGVLTDPAFASVFAPGSLAEVGIGGAPRGGRDGLAVLGQIDRLVILEGRILIVDYKTNRPPPSRVEDVPLGYIAQLSAYRALLQQIYPELQIEAALLWTYDARLMPVPAAALDRAHHLTLA